MKQVHDRITSGQIALIAVGSNLASGDDAPKIIVSRALSEICATFGDASRESRIFSAPAFPEGSGPDFANAVVRVEINLDASDIIARLHGIEAEFGRERHTRWGPRVLDLDLLAVGDRVLPDRETLQHWIDLPLEDQKSRSPDGLILPHPRLQDRAFVLVPLADVAPGWHHPLTGATVPEMLAALPATEREAIRPMTAS